MFYAETATQFVFAALPADERKQFQPITQGSMDWAAYSLVYAWAAADFQKRMILARTDARNAHHEGADAAAPEHASTTRPTASGGTRGVRRSPGPKGSGKPNNSAPMSEPTHTPQMINENDPDTAAPTPAALSGATSAPASVMNLPGAIPDQNTTPIKPATVSADR